MKLTEHIDNRGVLHVPVERAWVDRTPKRDGWVPYWVNINLARSPQKMVLYRRAA